MKKIAIMAAALFAAMPARAETIQLGTYCNRPAVSWLTAAPCMSRLIRDVAATRGDITHLPVAAAIDAFADAVRAGQMTEEQAKAKTDALIAERNAVANAADLKRQREEIARRETLRVQQLVNEMQRQFEIQDIKRCFNGGWC